MMVRYRDIIMTVRYRDITMTVRYRDTTTTVSTWKTEAHSTPEVHGANLSLSLLKEDLESLVKEKCPEPELPVLTPGGGYTVVIPSPNISKIITPYSIYHGCLPCECFHRDGVMEHLDDDHTQAQSPDRMDPRYFSGGALLSFTVFSRLVQMLKWAGSGSFPNVEQRGDECSPQCLVTVEKNLHRKVVRPSWIQQKVIK